MCSLFIVAEEKGHYKPLVVRLVMFTWVCFSQASSPYLLCKTLVLQWFSAQKLPNFSEAYSNLKFNSIQTERDSKCYHHLHILHVLHVMHVLHVAEVHNKSTPGIYRWL